LRKLRAFAFCAMGWHCKSSIFDECHRDFMSRFCPNEFVWIMSEKPRLVAGFCPKVSDFHFMVYQRDPQSR
jgi:hypothetical protein